MGEMKNLGCAIRDDSNAINTKNLLFPSPHSIMQKNRISGISAVGSAGGLGPSGREFESPISDQNE